MSKLTALAVSIAVLGGVWAYIALGPLGAGDGDIEALVWAGFIAWGAYFALGADNAALQKTIAGMIYGAVIAGIALYLNGTGMLGGLGVLGTAIIVAVTVFFLVIVANINLLSAVPANVFGYASTVAYALHQADAGSVTAIDLTNPVILVAISAVLGAVFGMVSGKLAAKLGG